MADNFDPKNKYLHINKDTGEMEWAEGGGSSIFDAGSIIEPVYFDKGEIKVCNTTPEYPVNSIPIISATGDLVTPRLVTNEISISNKDVPGVKLGSYIISITPEGLLVIS